jgi:hypothetical protein
MKKLKKLILKRVPFCRLASVAVSGAGLLAFGAHAQAQQIGVQFQSTATGAPALTPSDIAGVVPQDNFNVFNDSIVDNGPGVGGPLVDNTGNPSGASLVIDANKTYITNNSFAAGGDQILMSSGLNSGYSNGHSVIAENIPYATYDVYVLATTDNTNLGNYETFQLTPDSGPVLSLSLQPDPFLSTYVPSADTYDGSASTPPSTIPLANYVEFTGLTSPDFSLSFTGQKSNGSNFNSSLNGIEIVEAEAAPEPSTFALLAGGALALGAYQLRRRNCSI